jgi:hypothetical protein
MAALSPVIIGWVNEARDRAAMAEGRTVLVAAQAILAEEVSLTPGFLAGTITAAAYPASGNYDAKFRGLVAGIPGPYTVVYTIPGGNPQVDSIAFTATGGRNVHYLLAPAGHGWQPGVAGATCPVCP